MKKLIPALAFTLVTGAALAQVPNTEQSAPVTGAEQSAPVTGSVQSASATAAKHPRMEHMQDNLGLTDEQVQKMRQIRDNGGTREEMNAVLTPEQRVKAAEFRKNHKGELAQRRSHMKEELGLTDEQMAKMEEIRKNGGSRQELRAVLTPEQQTKFDAMRASKGQQTTH